MRGHSVNVFIVAVLCATSARAQVVQEATVQFHGASNLSKGALLVAVTQGSVTTYNADPFTVEADGSIDPIPLVELPSGATETVGIVAIYDTNFVAFLDNFNVLQDPLKFNWPTVPLEVSESDVLADLQNGTSSNLVTFMQHGPMFQLNSDGTRSGGYIFGFSPDNNFAGTVDLAFTTVPEPSSVVLAALGFLGLATWAAAAAFK